MMGQIFDMCGAPTRESWPDYASLPMAPAFAAKPRASRVRGRAWRGRVRNVYVVLGSRAEVAGAGVCVCLCAMWSRGTDFLSAA
jgi:hypothetical protein